MQPSPKTVLLIISFLCSIAGSSQKKAVATAKEDAPDSIKNLSMPGLSFRSIGPAITGGRIVDIAVNPKNHSEYFVASGHGSLWKTVNNGITFSPAFEGQTAYAMGAVTYDPSNTNIVWAGTGENNNQSNVIYGDGIYKSEDGGASWKNMGLKSSEYIGGVVVDPGNTDVVYVAAYGPVRNEGGDRGIFKSNDGGKTWRNVLKISNYTGCREVHMDPRNANNLYAVAHQRMSKGNTGIGGGEESAIYKSTDSGATWQKAMKGLPSESVGRIGMAISPANPDLLYALVQAKEGSGLYKSLNRGATWTKESSYTSAYPFYMQRIFADPKEENKLYSMDLLIQVSMDGGKTFKPLGEKDKHVDNHAIWIDPGNTKHLLSGNDGGVYESWDMGKNWGFKANLPIAEIYKINTDNALPFYNVYIGTQDNNSLAGPSRTINSSGITNRDWTFTLGGDGFETQADWKDDNTLYVQSQNGGLVRYNKQTGEQLYIKPVNIADTGYRFDWDAPLLISQFDNKRLYFAANRLFRSNNQGNKWDIISPDLTRGVPQTMQRLMGRSWSIDELASKASRANITSIAESPIDQNLLYAGTGDGLIQVTTNAGDTWTKGNAPMLDEFTRVHHIVASRHNKSVAYAACTGFYNGDYKPLLLKTTDAGKSWSVINANLPDKGNTNCVAEDHINPNLLFVGTHFGLFYSVDGGKEWIKFKNGLPTTAVMDMEIQRRENDLVVATFGRGVYILDDYAALRNLATDTLAKKAAILDIKNGQMFIEANPLGFAGKGFQGSDFYAAKNPATGAWFTYFIKKDAKTLKEQRREAEKELQKKGEDIAYPTYEILRKESEQPDPYLLFTITDDKGNVVRKIKTDFTKGVRRINWNMRYDAFTPIDLTPNPNPLPWEQEDEGYMVVPGTYYVSLDQFVDGQFTQLVPAKAFECKPLNSSPMAAADITALKEFNSKVAELSRAMNGADAYRKELVQKLPFLKQAVLSASAVPTGTYEQVLDAEKKLDEVNRKLNGDGLRGRYEAAVPVSLKSRINIISGALWSTTATPTDTYRQSYDIAADGFSSILESLKSINSDIEKIEAQLEKYKAPYTPGRLPAWSKS